MHPSEHRKTVQQPLPVMFGDGHGTWDLKNRNILRNWLLIENKTLNNMSSSVGMIIPNI